MKPKTGQTSSSPDKIADNLDFSVNNVYFIVETILHSKKQAPCRTG
jgi:hypothetical protein